MTAKAVQAMFSEQELCMLLDGVCIYIEQCEDYIRHESTEDTEKVRREIDEEYVPMRTKLELLLEAVRGA